MKENQNLRKAMTAIIVPDLKAKAYNAQSQNVGWF